MPSLSALCTKGQNSVALAKCSLSKHFHCAIKAGLTPFGATVALGEHRELWEAGLDGRESWELGAGSWVRAQAVGSSRAALETC